LTRRPQHQHQHQPQPQPQHQLQQRPATTSRNSVQPRARSSSQQQDPPLVPVEQPSLFLPLWIAAVVLLVASRPSRAHSKAPAVQPLPWPSCFSLRCCS
ncbi:hypothetical protein BGX23_004926, partial [Mortierella sp. AD031]